MPGRALVVLQIGSAVARALPLRPLTKLTEAVGPRIGPRLMPAKASQLQRHIARVERHIARFETDIARFETGIAQIETDIAQIETQVGDGGAPQVLEGGGPDWAAAAMRQGFGSYGRYWVESFRLPFLTDRALDRGFSFVGYGKIEQVRASGVGPILVLPHLGGWEWAAAWLGRIAKVDVTAVVERLEPEEVFDWFSRLRQAFGVNVIAVGPRAMTELTAAVRRRDVVCLLSDRDLSGTGVEVRFFGEVTTLPAGPALLARRTGAPLMPAAVFFRGRQRICLVGDPIWPQQLFPEGDTSVDRKTRTAIVMQEVANRLEDLVALAPEQWHLLEPNWPSDRVAAG